MGSNKPTLKKLFDFAQSLRVVSICMCMNMVMMINCNQGVLGEGEATFVALDPFVIKTLGHSHNAHTSRCI